MRRALRPNAEGGKELGTLHAIPCARRFDVQGCDPKVAIVGERLLDKLMEERICEEVGCDRRTDLGELYAVRSFAEVVDKLKAAHEARKAAAA